MKQTDNLCPTTWHLSRTRLFPHKWLIKQQGKKKPIPQSPRSCRCSWWAARHMKRRVKKRNPEASHGCSRFCDLIFKGSSASSTQDQTKQTNKALKMRHRQQGAEFSGNMPSRSGIDKHKLFDLGVFSPLLSMFPFGLKNTFKSSCCRGSLPHRCASALGRFQQHSDCAVGLVQRSLLVVGRHGRSWEKEKERNVSVLQSNNQSGIDQRPPVSSRACQLGT